jgi:hypothetical protein
MYGRNRDITLPGYGTDYIINLFARSIVYSMFNRDFSNPAFATFLNGSNVQYRTFGPYQLSPAYLRSGYAFWNPQDVNLVRINDAITKILDDKTPTTYLTPGGSPPGGDADLLGFYSSLTHPVD